MSRNDREHIWILWLTLFVLGAAVVTIAFLAAISDKADSDEVGTCQPFDAGIAAVLNAARGEHSTLLIVPPVMMSGFLAGLGDAGKGITGESALVVVKPGHKFALFVKRGQTLCLAISDDGDKPDGTDL